jgi:hypothetical protein
MVLRLSFTTPGNFLFCANRNQCLALKQIIVTFFINIVVLLFRDFYFKYSIYLTKYYKIENFGLKVKLKSIFSYI